jgi:HK97 family phage major capsid protein
MKKTLKEFRKMVADAKAAWLLTKKEKKAEADQKAALNDYQAKLALLDGFEADGKKDEDEVELPAEKAAPVIELGELQAMLTKSVEDVLAAKLPEHLKSQVTEAGIKAIVDAALAKHKVDGTKAPDAAQIKTILTEVVDTQIKALKMPTKLPGGAGAGTEDEGGEGKGASGHDKNGLIVVPFALTKGNLPLHFKQLLNVLLRKPMNEGIEAKAIEHGEKLGDNMFLAAKTMGLKALTSTGSGTGAEWVPRDLASELLRRLYLESQIAALMMANEIDMPTDPFDLPLSTTRPTFFKNATQNTAGTGSTPATAKSTLTTVKLMAQVDYSYEANEDAIIPLLPLLQTLLGEAGAQALERAIINGDTTGTHMDTDIAAITNDAAKSWMGLRKLALAQSTLKVDLSTGGISRANLIAIKKKLGKWGRRPSDLAWIVGPQGENDFLNLDEVITIDKRGAGATTVTGLINSYLGIPIVVSEENREDLNATGVNDGVTTTKGSVLLVNHRQFMLGNRRSFTLEVDRDITTQTNKIVASFRKAFQPVETPSATIKTVAVGYNYTA